MGVDGARIESQDRPDLGSCCICEKHDRTVRNIMMLNFKCAIPGHGWGCVTCHTTEDGAVAVICDDCLRRHNSKTVMKALKFACSGWPGEEGRTPIGELTEPFTHNMAYHAN